MDLLTGLLLTGVIIWIGYIVVRELFDESISEGLAKYFRRSENPVHDSLVGSIGKVVEISEGDGDQLKVRIGIELWNARLSGEGQQQLVAGTGVKVTAVNGMLLDVEAHGPD
jgi:membrane protein implicated in regulation of membrane protease activity